MPVFEVKLEREQSQVIYIEADDGREAVDAAWELAEERNWMEEDTHEVVRPVTHVPQRYWTGGAEGRWVEP